MISKYRRREWLKRASAAGMGMALASALPGCNINGSGASKTIMVVSGWQDVNIGDIAHTPGLLNVLQTFLPDVHIILWEKSASAKVEALLRKNFPAVRIVRGKVDAKKNVNDPDVVKALEESDLLIHGSGPFIVGKDNIEAWLKHTNKPFGIFGVTIQQMDKDLRSLLEKAAFIFTRETKSLEVLKREGLSGSHISFAPDATFYFNLRNEALAGRFLKENDLEEKKFICVIPRLRYTPYYKFRPDNAGWSEEKISHVEKVNELWKERDHSKLRTAMIAWVRETGNKVLVCPEMSYEVNIMDELLIDPLPGDVRPFVVKHGYWLPDEAASVYARAHSLLSFECHSPIIALATGTPSFYLRQPEDTIKGQMCYDLGLQDFVFGIDQTEGRQIADALRNVWSNYGEAKMMVKKTMTRVNQIYRHSSRWIEKSV